MSIKVTLEKTMHDAMRNKDEITRDTIRVVLSSIKFSEIEVGKPLEENGILSIIQKEVKIRKETISDLDGTDRYDLVEKAQQELEVLEKFLPTQLSDDEIEKFAREVIENTAAKNPSDMGKVMGTLIPKLAGQAPPDRISQVVRKILLQQ